MRIVCGAAPGSAFDYGPDQLPGHMSCQHLFPGSHQAGEPLAWPLHCRCLWRCFSPATFAADVLVITDSRHPVKTMGGERLIELDEAPRIEAELSAELPAEPEQATAIVKRRPEQRRHRSPTPHRFRLPGRHRRVEPGHHQHPGRRGGSTLRRLWRTGCGPRSRSHRAALEGPAVTLPIRPDAPPACWRGVRSAAQRHGQLRAQHRNHRRLGGIARLPRIPRRRDLLLALLHLDGLYGTHVHQGPPLHPDAIVSSYSNTGENPWIEVRPMSTPNPSAQTGGDGTTNEDHENNLAKFKNADVIGHPGVEVFNQFVSSSGYFCEGAGTAFMPYLLGTLDTLAWRYNVPEMAYPEALIPGMREVGARTTMNLWGNVYPRGVSCTRPTTTRPVRWWPSAQAMSSRAGDRSTFISRCSPTPAMATGRLARSWRAMPRRASGRNSRQSCPRPARSSRAAAP